MKGFSLAGVSNIALPATAGTSGRSTGVGGWGISILGGAGLTADEQPEAAHGAGVNLQPNHLLGSPHVRGTGLDPGNMMTSQSDTGPTLSGLWSAGGKQIYELILELFH